MKKIFLASLAAAVAFSMVGCKGKLESRADGHLKEGRYANAIKSYVEAAAKGDVSEEYYDNFGKALIFGAEKELKANIASEKAEGYFDKFNEIVDKVQDTEIINKYISLIADQGKTQAGEEGADFDVVVNAFAKIDSAASLAKRRGINESSVKALRTEAENAYVSKNIGLAKSESDPVVAEYQLLKLAEIAPTNEEVQTALNKNRKGTRGYFLIFGEQIGEKISRRIDKYGYVMAMPTIKLNATSLSGEIQFWASTGNNTELDPTKIKLVSADGKEVFATTTGGWCEKEELVGPKNNQKIEKKKKPFKKNEKGKLMNEFQCSANIAFSFPKGFVPDYIEYTDVYGSGKKFLGK